MKDEILEELWKSKDKIAKEHNHNIVHLLPYHRLGVSKLKRINRNDETAIQKCGKENMERVKILFNKWGIEAIIYE